MAQKEAIMRALMQAMAGESGKTISDADRQRISQKMGESGKTISDADRMRLKSMMGKSGAPARSMRPKMRPNMIGGTPRGSTRGIDPMDNYSAEDLQRLLKSARGGVSNFKTGGAVKKKRSPNKPNKGCVMSGRGGKYKGMK